MPSVRRHVFAQLALFACTAHAGIDPIDPPYCATRVTGFVADITGVAQQAVAITGDCIGPGKSDVDCALDVLSMLATLIDSAEMLSAMSFACAGEHSSCETTAIDSAEYFITIASRLLAAANACDEDVFLCVIFVIDAADNIVNFASDVQVAVQTCVPPSSPPAVAAAAFANPTLVSQSSDSQISPFYLAVTGKSTVVDVNNTGGGVNFLLKGRQGGSGGTTIAVDHPGIVRIGSAFASPTAPAFIFREGSAMTSYHNRRLEGKQERNDDVLYYYIDEDSALQEDYGFTLAGLE